MNYTPQQLKSMAEHYMQARANGDPRCWQLLLMMEFWTGLRSPEIEARIESLAKNVSA